VEPVVRHGLTQAQLAQAMGVTPGRVSQIERGELTDVAPERVICAVRAGLCSARRLSE